MKITVSVNMTDEDREAIERDYYGELGRSDEEACQEFARDAICQAVSKVLAVLRREKAEHAAEVVERQRQERDDHDDDQM